jgi:lipid-A-disaccharide synthase-like uncharacterized protein
MEEWLQIILSKVADPWFALGIVGQLMFSGRFLVQWLVSEKQSKSVVPIAFWYFSIGGGICLFVYGIKQAEPIIILGQSIGLLIYARNLYFIRRERKTQKAETEAKKASEVPQIPAE